MGAEIDRLEVQVEAQATKANNQLDKLVGKLDRVSGALSNLNSSGLAELSSGVSKFAQASAQLSNVKTTDFTRLATNLAKLGNVNTSALNSFASSMSHLTSAFNAFSGVNFDNKNVQNLINSIIRLSNTNVGNLASIDFSQIGNSISKLATSLNNAPKIQQSVISMTNAIANLAKSGQNIPIVSASLGSLGDSLNKFFLSISSAPAISENTIAFSQAIASLSNAGAKAGATASNLSALGVGLNNLMTTLSKAPSVNRNIIDMTNALANLASQGNRVGSSSNSLVNGLNRTSSAMARTRKSSISLAAAFGKFYASWWLVIRGASKLWDSIENSMNYVEVLNYFDAAMQQVSSNAGESSADAYFESFSSRAKELTSKMTGFNVNDDGTLTATGNASLGINPTKLMNYQATFAQMSSSIGVTAETSLLLSQALTEIGADLASVKNMDFDKVWKDMASGLAGMSRTLDKYGVNIRNVNLQQKLFDLGINENITNLNQNDKALLRAIILLDSTKYAWGDLADTLEQPANQLRLLESNFSNLSRTLGNLFLPVVSKLLPYVNGLVIGLQRLFAWVGNLLGIDLSGITSAVGDSAVDIGDLLDEADGASDALGSAAENAKKLKTATMGIDELNINSPQDNSGSGSGPSGGISSGLLDEAFEEAFAEYQKVWDEAFANMENRANEFADKVEKFLQPVRDIIEDFAIGDFFKAGQDTSNLVAGIFNFFADAIDKVNWKKIGNNIGDYLAGINWADIMDSVGNVAWEALKAAIELWSGMFEEAPIETLLITFGAIGFKLGYLNLTKDLFKKTLADFIGLESTATGGFLLSISASLVITWTLENLIKDEDSFIRKFLDKNAYSEEDRETYQGFNDFTWTENIKKNFEEIKQGWSGLFDFGDTDHPSIFEFYGEKLASFRDTFNQTMADTFGDWAGVTIPEAANAIGNWFTEDVSPWFTKEKWEELGQNVNDGLSAKWTDFSTWWQDTGIPNWWDKNVIPWFTKEKWMSLGENIKGGISYKWAEFTLWWKNTGFYKWWKDVGEYFDKKAWTWDGIKEGLSASWNAAIDSIKNIWNAFANWLNDKLTWEIEPVYVAGTKVFDGATINLGKIPTFSIGGFPEDGLFMANHNELVGQFSNGRTAVANNEQIIEGISYGVKSAVEEVLSPYLQQIAQNTRETADKDASVYIGDREIARANNRGQKAMGLRIRTT